MPREQVSSFCPWASFAALMDSVSLSVTQSVCHQTSTETYLLSLKVNLSFQIFYVTLNTAQSMIIFTIQFLKAASHTNIAHIIKYTFNKAGYQKAISHRT